MIKVCLQGEEPSKTRIPYHHRLPFSWVFDIEFITIASNSTQKLMKRLFVDNWLTAWETFLNSNLIPPSFSKDFVQKSIMIFLLWQISTEWIKHLLATVDPNWPFNLDLTYLLESGFQPNLITLDEIGSRMGKWTKLSVISESLVGYCCTFLPFWSFWFWEVTQ